MVSVNLTGARDNVRPTPPGVAQVSLVDESNAWAIVNLPASQGWTFFNQTFAFEVPVVSAKVLMDMRKAAGAAMYVDNLEVRDVTPTGTVATPVMLTPEGTYLAPLRVSIETSTEGAEIRYTTDGSAPSRDSLLYANEPIIIQVRWRSKGACRRTPTCTDSSPICIALLQAEQSKRKM